MLQACNVPRGDFTVDLRMAWQSDVCDVLLASVRRLAIVYGARNGDSSLDVRWMSITLSTQLV